MICCTGVLGKQIAIKVLELRALVRRDHRAKLVVQITDNAANGAEDGTELIRHTGHRGLQHEAREVVALEQVLAVEHAAGEVGQVDACEGVDGAGVATETHDARIHEVVHLGLWAAMMLADGRGRGATWKKELTSRFTPGIVRPEAVGRLYQLSGMRSWPSWWTKLPGVPVTAKKDIKVSRVSVPSGFSAEWFDIRLMMKLWAAGGTRPESGPCNDTLRSEQGLGDKAISRASKTYAEVVRVIEDGLARRVIVLGGDHVEGVFLSHGVEMLPVVHLEHTDLATVEVGITLLLVSRRFLKGMESTHLRRGCV